MPSAFDPVLLRTRMLDVLLDENLESARAAAKESGRPRRWESRLNSVVLAHAVGVGDDPRVDELLGIVLEQLEPGRWAAQRGELTSYSLAGTWETLALARWLATGRAQTELFREAHSAFRPYFEETWGKKKKWSVEDASLWVALACSGEDFASAMEFVDRPPLRERGAVDPARVRTALDFGQLLTRSRLHGEPTAETLEDAGQRLLRNQVAACLEGGRYAETARLLYLVGLGSPDDTPPRARLAQLTDHVSYLATAKAADTKAKAKASAPATATAKKSPPSPAPAPIARRALPPIALSAVHFETGHEPTWTETKTEGGSRWSLRSPNDRDIGPSRDRRFPLLYEIQTRNPDLATSPLLTKLVRGTLDGEMLSTLAARPSPASLEVAFPFGVSNYFDGAQVQVPPRLSRGIWRKALAVGSLVNLRALSFNAAESDKERLARGAKPYVVGAPWFWDSPLARQLEALDVSADPHDLGVWRERFQALPRLARVYLRVRPQDYGKIGYLFRFVLDRDGDQIRLTLQGAASPVTADRNVFQTLFAGTAGMFSSLGFERLREPVTDASAIAKLLGAYGEVREARGQAKLLEL